jgi:hypothetical protein
MIFGAMTTTFKNNSSYMAPGNVATNTESFLNRVTITVTVTESFMFISAEESPTFQAESSVCIEDYVLLSFTSPVKQIVHKKNTVCRTAHARGTIWLLCIPTLLW